MNKQQKDDRRSAQRTGRKTLSEKEKSVEKHQDDGDANLKTPTKPAGGINKGKCKTVKRKLVFRDDDYLQSSSDAVSGDSDEEFPDPNEKMKRTVKISRKYPMACEDYVKGKQVKSYDLEAIYQDRPGYVAKVKVKRSAREELSKLLKDLQIQPRNLGRHTMEILDKTETRDKPKLRPKNAKEPAKCLRAYTLEKPEDPVKRNCYFLSCEYMLTIHLPDDSMSWFDYNEKSKLIANIKDGKKNKRWIFIPSFRRAKIALLDWPKDKRITEDNTIRLLVVRPSQFDEYVRYCGHQVPVICLPHDEIGAGYPRFWIQKIAFWLKLPFIWMLDDSVIWFRKFNPTKTKKNRGPHMEFGDVFLQIEKTVNKFVKTFPNNQIAAVSPRRHAPYLKNVKKHHVCKPPQCAVYLNIDVLSSKRIHYRPELPQFEDMMFAYECEKNGLKVYMDNRILVMDCHMWNDSGASSRSVRPVSSA